MNVGFVPKVPLAVGIAAAATGGATFDAAVSVGNAGPDVVGPPDLPDAAGPPVGALREEVAADVAAAERVGTDPV